MLFPLKFIQDKERKVFFYSDLHRKHDKSFIYNVRGFNNIKEHDERLIERWNNKVSNKDSCFLLGDSVVGAGKDGEKEFEFLINNLNFHTLYVCQGNHGSGFKQFWEKNFDYGIDKHYRLTFRGKSKEDDLSFGLVHLIPNYYEIFVNNQHIVLSHYPILSWNGSPDSFMIFGHCHNNLTKSEIGREYLKGKVLDVGPESVGAPVSFFEIQDLMNNRGNLSLDHH